MQDTRTFDQSTERMRESGQMAMDTGQRTMEQVEGLPANVYYGGVIASIALSALLFVLGKRNLGIFVGLWPPTLLNLALFTKLLRPSRELDQLR
jgi:hypothetical protein